MHQVSNWNSVRIPWLIKKFFFCFKKNCSSFAWKWKYIIKLSAIFWNYKTFDGIRFEGSKARKKYWIQNNKIIMINASNSSIETAKLSKNFLKLWINKNTHRSYHMPTQMASKRKQFYFWVILDIRLKQTNHLNHVFPVFDLK